MSEKVRFDHISNNFCFVCFFWGFFMISYNSFFICEDINNHAPLMFSKYVKVYFFYFKLQFCSYKVFIDFENSFIFYRQFRCDYFHNYLNTFNKNNNGKQ